MVTLFEADAHGLYKSSLEKMNFHNTKWLDVENPSDAQIVKVAELVGLSKREVRGLIDRNEIPRVHDLEHFTMVVFRAPYQYRHHHKHVSTTSVIFFVSERLLITLHRDIIGSLDDMLGSPRDELFSLFQKGTSELMYRIFEQLLNDFFVRLDAIEENIDKIEDLVFANPNQKTVKKIFSLKRTLIYFHKALAANRDILVTLQKDHMGKYIVNKVQRRLINLYYDDVQLIDVVATYRDILTGTLDIYLSAVSNNMNAVMKKMAAYSSLVLVPTFVTGLYGMNFRLIPELNWQYGYLFAWGVIIVSFTFLFIYFKRKNWF